MMDEISLFKHGMHLHICYMRAQCSKTPTPVNSCIPGRTREHSHGRVLFQVVMVDMPLIAFVSLQIDQSTEPTRVTISGTPHSLSLAVSMVSDIIKGNFKGFALLRQMASPAARAGTGQLAQPKPVYAPGYGLIPPSQVGL